MADAATKPRRRRPAYLRKKSFTEALKEKYCVDPPDSMKSGGFVVQIVYHGRPKSNGSDAELAHLRNVVLNEVNVAHAGIPQEGLTSLCPNVVDLDLANNMLKDWSEVLNIMHHLPGLKFVNIADNKLVNSENCLQKWTQPLNSIENLVLNRTYAPWEDIIAVKKLLPNLKELHICSNDYEDIPSINPEINVMKGLTCLRLNGNKLQSWEEVWKLRYFPDLELLILSDNPITDVYYSTVENDNKSGDINGNSEIQEVVKAIVDTVIQQACNEFNQNVENTQNSTTSDQIKSDNNENTIDAKLSDTHQTESVLFYLETEKDTSTCESSKVKPFEKLKSLCLSRTHLHSWAHIEALSQFPSLQSVRLQDIKLMENYTLDDKRKMKVASLPNIKVLNGSEISVDEREKAERHYIRYFSDKDEHPERLSQLHQKHGRLEPIVFIDISKGYKEFVTVSIIMDNNPLFTETIKLRNSVGELKKSIRQKIPASVRDTKYYRRELSLYHHACGEDHGDEAGNYEEMFLDSLPLSRHDIKDGDELHVVLVREKFQVTGLFMRLFIVAYLDGPYLRHVWPLARSTCTFR